MPKGIYEKAQEFTKEHSVVGCSIADKNRMFIAFQFNGDAEGSIVCYYYPKTERTWGGVKRGGFYRTNGCILPNENNAYIMTGWQGAVLAQHGLDEGGRPNMIVEEPIPILPNCPIESIRIIDGQAYIAAAWRTVFRRDDVDQWTCLRGNDSEEIKKLKEGDHTGFNDIGGFSKDEIYACGENGDLWHFNGSKWRSLSAPTNKHMVAMCCAPTGKVYIGCDDGTLIEGRDESWKVLEHKTPSHLNDMVWYKDKLYISCGMYGLNVYDEKNISSASGLSSFGSMLGKEEEISEGTKLALETNGISEDDANLFEALSTVKITDDVLAPASMHTLATDGEILLVAGGDRVVAFNGDEWKMLYSPHPSKQGGELW